MFSLAQFLRKKYLPAFEDSTWFIRWEDCFCKLPIIHCSLCDQVLLPLWLLLCVRTGMFRAGLLSCFCCQTLETVWNLSWAELQRGRNRRGWFDWEERTIISWGVASSRDKKGEVPAFQEERGAWCGATPPGVLFEVYVVHSWAKQRKNTFKLIRKLIRRRKKSVFFFWLAPVTPWLGCMDASRTESKFFLSLNSLRFCNTLRS